MRDFNNLNKIDRLGRNKWQLITILNTIKMKKTRLSILDNSNLRMYKSDRQKILNNKFNKKMSIPNTMRPKETSK